MADFEEHVRALQTLVSANVERNVTLTEAMAKVRELLGSGRSYNKSGYSMKIFKLTREVQRPTQFVESKNLELHVIPELVEEPSCLREKI